MELPFEIRNLFVNDTECFPKEDCKPSKLLDDEEIDSSAAIDQLRPLSINGSTDADHFTAPKNSQAIVNDGTTKGVFSKPKMKAEPPQHLPGAGVEASALDSRAQRVAGAGGEALDSTERAPSQISQAVTKLLQASKLLSSCGLDVCMAVSGQKRLQFWTSNSWREDIENGMRQLANLQAGLDTQNRDVEMFVRLDLVPGTSHNERDDTSEMYVDGTSELSMVYPDVEFESVGGITLLSDGEDHNQVIEDLPERVDVIEVIPLHSKRTVVEAIDTINEDQSDITNPMKQYKCDVCNFTTAYRHSLQYHKMSHDGEKPHKCPLCDFSSSMVQGLHSHMRTHTGEKPYKCELCDYRAARCSGLKEHVTVVHQGLRRFKCEACDFTTAYKKELNDHKRTHTGDLLTCDCCDFKTPKQYALRRHKRQHTGDTFNCELCSYKSTRKCHLQAHMRRHTGEKPLKCKLCDYRTAHSKSLYSHMRTHTGDLFYCTVCQYKTNRKDNFLKHMKNCHPVHSNSNTVDGDKVE